MKNLYAKLAKIQGIAVKKDSNNPFFKSKYQSLDEIVSTLNPLLNEHKLLVYHSSHDGCVITSVADIETGLLIESSFKLPDIQDIQKLGAAITYAKRYNLGQLFNIVTDEDNDGNKSESHEHAKKIFVEDDKPWLEESTFDLKVAPWIVDEYKKGSRLDVRTILMTLRMKYKVAKKFEEVISNFISKL